jgi:hypothetical protein
MIEEFDRYFKDWVASACKDWGYLEPSNEYFARVYRRLPEGLRVLLGLGVKEEIIISQGRTFTLKGLSPKKGPYNWFSQYSSAKEPAPNWEYFIQVAEFVRLYHIATAKGLILTFEDDLMDLALYLNDKLTVCCEVKERASKLQELIKGIKVYQQSINFTVADRGNDPLRKAKYIAKRRPQYFCGVAIGARFEYRVDYPKGYAFQLVKDVIPWI